MPLSTDPRRGEFPSRGLVPGLAAPLIASLLLILTLAAPAAAQTAWTTLEGGGEVGLFDVDLRSTAITELGSLGPIGAGLLVAETEESFFMVEIFAPRRLHHIDVDTVTRTEIGPLGAAVDPEFRLTGLARGPDGRLWLAGNSSLFEVDAATGAAALVGPTSRIVEALAHDGTRLLALGLDDQFDYGLYEVDEATGVLTELHLLPDVLAEGSATMDVSPLGALWIQAENQIPVTPPSSRHQIYRVDIETGVSELISEEIETPTIAERQGFVVLGVPSVTDVPTLTPFGIAGLAALLGGLALMRLRRR